MGPGRRLGRPGPPQAKGGLVAGPRRKSHPPVTLARLKGTPAARVGDYAAAHNGFAIPPFRLDRFTLYQSQRGNERVHYEALAEYPLAD